MPSAELYLDKRAREGLETGLYPRIRLTAAIAVDQAWSGLTAQFTAGENLTFAQGCYLKNDSKMWKAKADVVGTMPLVGLACGAISADALGEFLLIGFMREDTIFSFTVGAMLYVSAATAGALVETAPAASGNQVQVLGKCFPSAHIIYFNPSFELVEIA